MKTLILLSVVVVGCSSSSSFETTPPMSDDAGDAAVDSNPTDVMDAATMMETSTDADVTLVCDPPQQDAWNDYCIMGMAYQLQGCGLKHDASFCWSTVGPGNAAAVSFLNSCEVNCVASSTDSCDATCMCMQPCNVFVNQQVAICEASGSDVDCLNGQGPMSQWGMEYLLQCANSCQ